MLAPVILELEEARQKALREDFGGAEMAVSITIAKAQMLGLLQAGATPLADCIPGSIAPAQGADDDMPLVSETKTIH